MTFTDEDLTAYLDGEAEADLAQAIDVALAEDAALGARLDRLRPLGEGALAAFDPLLAHAPRYPLSEAVAAPRWRVPAGFAAALVIGLGLGFAWRGSAPADQAMPTGWMGYVAAYQALYVPQTLAGVAPPKAAQADQLAQLGTVLGRDLSLPQVERISYRRGQILGFDGQSLIQLAYLSDTGQPVALCIIKRPDEGDSAPQVARMEGMEAAYWVRDGYGFLLIGGQDADLISDAAAQFHAAL